jgi:hypothetical protein
VASGAKLQDLMAPMGHDSERTAMIYQHESRGADKAITDAIDRHVKAEQDDATMKTAGGWHAGPRWLTGPLMARQLLPPGGPTTLGLGSWALSWALTLERVTKIELALSAWESDRSAPLGPLTS